MACAAATISSSDLRARGNSDLVALAVEKVSSSDLRPGGNSDLVAGLEGIQIQWPAKRRHF